MSSYTVRDFDDPVAAIKDLGAMPPAAIVLDEDAPVWSGLKVIDKIRRHDTLVGTPMVCIARKNGSSLFRDAVRHGNHAMLVKPFKRSDLLNAISRQVNKGVEANWNGFEPLQKSALTKTVKIFNGISDLIDEGKPLPYEDLKESCAPLVDAISSHHFKDILKGVRGHDNYSYVHSLRVATILSLFGFNIGIRGSDLTTLATGGLVHDIGKMSIPLDVLNKPGRLVGDEWETMKSHVPKTVGVLGLSADMPKGVLTIAEQHHEKLNGTGYPRQLKGTQLNNLARMASIVDIFGALTDRRVYKDPMAPEAALALMADMKDELDQHLLKIFRTILMDTASAFDQTGDAVATA
ncbi:MAG: HD domain-containing protein [Alphaproteobacteria bacterium]